MTGQFSQNQKMFRRVKSSAVKEDDSITINHSLSDLRQYEKFHLLCMNVEMNYTEMRFYTHTTPYLISPAAYALAAKLEGKLSSTEWTDDTLLYIIKAKIGPNQYDYTLCVLSDSRDDISDWIVIGEEDLECEGGEELAEALFMRLSLFEKKPFTNLDTDVAGYETARFTVAKLQPFLPTLANTTRYKLWLLIN